MKLKKQNNYWMIMNYQVKQLYLNNYKLMIVKNGNNFHFLYAPFYYILNRSYSLITTSNYIIIPTLSLNEKFILSNRLIIGIFFVLTLFIYYCWCESSWIIDIRRLLLFCFAVFKSFVCILERNSYN